MHSSVGDRSRHARRCSSPDGEHPLKGTSAGDWEAQILLALDIWCGTDAINSQPSDSTGISDHVHPEDSTPRSNDDPLIIPL